MASIDARGSIDPTQIKLAILLRDLTQVRDRLQEMIVNPAWTDYFSPAYKDDTDTHQLYAADEDEVGATRHD